MFRLVIISALLVSSSFGALISLRDPRILDGRIVGGAEAKIEDYPYQLSLQYFGQHSCGASIISSKYVVTAAHCTEGRAPQYLRISAGSTNKRDGTLYGVQSIKIHPRFNMFNIDYDISLLELTKELEFSKFIQPLKLAESEAKPGTMANVTGWGALWQGGSVSESLQKVEVPIVSRELCSKAYGYVNEITSRMICAGDYAEGGKDSCQGDSGGPLVVDNVQYGIVSWGYGCAQPNYPGVYTNVAALREWIKETIGF